jgi:hypothetical protein
MKLFDYAGSFQYNVETSQVFRDVSAWFHIVVSIDTTQATSTNRVKLYINGTQVSAFSTATYPSQNYDTLVNAATGHFIGGSNSGGYSEGFNGYLADIHFIDGQALDPTSFGEFDTNGIWQPIEYTGTYGTNGFHLDFADNASTTTIGYDAAGSNDWTANNLSVTAGAGNDSLVDVPTNGAETDTGAGGEVRGNYATLNPLQSNSTGPLANGNLEWGGTDAGNFQSSVATIGMSSGKWYAEFTRSGASGDITCGIARITNSQELVTTSYFVGGTATSYGYYASNGNKFNSGSGSSYGASYGDGDTIGVAFDADNGTLSFYKNGVSQGTAFTGLTGTFAFACSVYQTTKWIVNFGQRPFAYTAPSDFKALNTTNLPAPVVTKPSTVMDVKLYTGNGSTQTISGLGFSPDLVWYKSRSSAVYNHGLFDIVRGTSAMLRSNTTDAESTISGVTAFNSDGFTLGSDNGGNESGGSMVAWTWDAGSSTVTNTQGSISSQVRANASAGFSIVTYTGTGAAATVGHGLGVAPFLIIVKSRVATLNTSWAIYHKDIGSDKWISFDTSGASSSTAGAWNSTAPTSSVFSIGTFSIVNESTKTYVAYCFAPVAGYSAYGLYTGNGSADGSFTYLGFLPKLILIKRTDTTSNWTILDTSRLGYNVDNDPLYPNLADAEGTTDLLDITSNGFKLRSTDASVNASGGTYIFAAWASNPFQYSRAR